VLGASIIMETTFKKYQQSWNVNGKTTSPTTNKHINYVAEELDLIKDWTI